MGRERFEELYAAFERAQDAVSAHFQTLRRAVGYGDQLEEKGERPLTRAWLDEHRRLWDKRDSAHDALLAHLRQSAAGLPIKIEYQGGPKSGQEDSFADQPSSIGTAEDEGVYQRTKGMSGDRIIYKWRPMTPDEADQILRDAE